MKGFAKVYGTILDSSLWGESKDVKLLFMTMLFMADENSLVSASLSGLARRAGLTREECETALQVLEAPDPDDTSGVDEGRRVRRVARGWFITNHRSYRDFRTEAQEQGAERVRRHRAKNKGVTSVTSNDVTPGNASKRTEAEADSEADPNPNQRVVAKDLTGLARASASGANQPPVVEPQEPEPKLTICPLDLVEKAEAVGIVGQFVERYRVEPGQIREAIREFVTFWTIGAGTGRKDANWFKKLRHDLKFKCETPGKLKAPGALEHQERTEGLTPEDRDRVKRLAEKHRPKLLAPSMPAVAGRGGA